MQFGVPLPLPAWNQYVLGVLREVDAAGHPIPRTGRPLDRMPAAEDDIEAWRSWAVSSYGATAEQAAGLGILALHRKYGLGRTRRHYTRAERRGPTGERPPYSD